jgi:hypothetical protein
MAPGDKEDNEFLDRQSSRLNKIILEMLTAGLIAAVLAHFIVALELDETTSNQFGGLRQQLFTYIGSFLLVPVFGVRFFLCVPLRTIPSKPRVGILARSLFFLSFAGLLQALPFMLWGDGHARLTKAGALANSLHNSLFGLALLGTPLYIALAMAFFVAIAVLLKKD